MTVGVATNQYVEIVTGLKEGDAVLRNPRVLADRLADSLNDAKEPAPGRLKPTQFRLRSVKQADDGDRRTFVNRYGLLDKDFERIQELESISNAVPVRSFPQEVRRLERIFHGQVVATTKDYAWARSLKVASGRFLSAEDEEEGRNVAALGAGIADELFGSEDPVGQSIVVNGQPFVVIGVLREIQAKAPEAYKTDVAVHIPLRTCKRRFGETIYVRQSGSRRGEQVQLTEIIVTVPDVSRTPATIRAVSDLLRKTHDHKDWGIDTGRIEDATPSK